MRLPLSGLDVSFRVPDGHDDLAILEASADTTASRHQVQILERALHALSRLATLAWSPAASHPTPTPETPSWCDITVTDFEAALLGFRRFLFGDTVQCIVPCACSERMEFDFSISHLLHDVQPRTPGRIRPCADRPGWFQLHPGPKSQHKSNAQPLPATNAIFRLPTISDQLLALRSPHPYAYLRQRCIEAPEHTRQPAAAIERAMELMSPALSRPIHGVCVGCGASLDLQLHVPSLVLSDLRGSAAEVHREIHIIAASYHWDEAAILALPQLRRQAYTDTIRQAGAP